MATSNITTDRDFLILAMGTELDALFQEYNRLEKVGTHTTDTKAKDRISKHLGSINKRIGTLQDSISAFPATGIEAAIVQLKVMFNGCDWIDNDATHHLAYSILGVLRSRASDSARERTDKYFMPDRFNPFVCDVEGLE